MLQTVMYVEFLSAHARVSLDIFQQFRKLDAFGSLMYGGRIRFNQSKEISTLSDLSKLLLRWAFVYFQDSKDVRNVVKQFVDKEIMKCKTVHGTTFFTIQADQGETRAQEIEQYVREKGGEIRHSCAYSPEQQAMIERFWRTIAEMSTAMILAAKLGEPFWEDATQYATVVYNHTPRHHLGRKDMAAPIQLYTKESHTMKHFQPFGCRAYVHIPSQIRRKNHKGRAEQAIFVGMDDNIVQGYRLL